MIARAFFRPINMVMSTREGVLPASGRRFDPEESYFVEVKGTANPEPDLKLVADLPQ